MSIKNQKTLVLIFLFIFSSCAHQEKTKSPALGSYAEADLLLEAILGHLEGKKKYSCIQNDQEGYLLIRTLRPHLEEREQKDALEVHSQLPLECLKNCECSSLYSISSGGKKEGWQKLLESEFQSKCREAWMIDICDKKLMKTIQEEKKDFEIPLD